MDIRPKLRPDLVVLEHADSSGSRDIVLKDPVSGKFYRLSSHEHKFLQVFDGTVTLEEAIERFNGSGQYCSEEEGLRIIEKAGHLGLVLGTRYGTAQYQGRLKEQTEQARKARRFSSVYFLFIPLLNPDKFLEKTLWLFKLFANKLILAIIAILAPGALYFVITGLPRMEQEYLFFFNLQNLIYLWITIALTKLIHEFSHAYAAKSFGLHVPQMGLAFLIFFPCLFCNTTEAWQLADRRQRMVISAAGIISEGAMAVVATYIWHFSGPGIVNSLAFYLLAVSFVSTVLFNGNPLMKFDGYFILIDYLRMPNLQGKSFSYLRYLFMNRVLGLDSVPDPSSNQNDGALFTIYGAASFIYRIFLYTGIVGGVYYRFDKTLGAALALLAFVLFIVRPIVRGVKNIYLKRTEMKPRISGVAVFSLLLALLLIPLFVPLSAKSVYPCLVGSAKVQKLTVPLRTSVGKVFIREGSVVAERDVLFELDTSELELAMMKKTTEQAVLRRELEVMLLDLKEMGKAPGKQLELDRVAKEIEQIREELDTARGGIVAPFGGVITSLDYKMQPGYRPGEGTVVGELQAPGDLVVHALIPEQDRERVRPGETAEVLLPIGAGKIFVEKVQSLKPYNEKDLRNSPFSSRLGGELATEVRGEQRRDVPLQAQYKCTLPLSDAGWWIPLGMTGRLAVASRPQTIFSWFLDAVFRVFNTESLM
jgi:putative peptide zinc metalloprotease protein